MRTLSLFAALAFAVAPAGCGDDGEALGAAPRRRAGAARRSRWPRRRTVR